MIQEGRIRPLQRTVRVSRRNRYQPEHLDRMAVNGPGRRTVLDASSYSNDNPRAFGREWAVR